MFSIASELFVNIRRFRLGPYGRAAVPVRETTHPLLLCSETLASTLNKQSAAKARCSSGGAMFPQFAIEGRR